MTLWRPPQAIRVKALGLLVENGHLFAADVPADTGELKGVRPLGGSIEFGESRDEALRREFREELRTEIEITGPFVCFENIFVHEGARGHEIVFLAPIRLLGRQIALGDVVTFFEDDGMACRARWHRLEALCRGEPALYPEGLVEHLVGA